jgi:hypothetical protein
MSQYDRNDLVIWQAFTRDDVEGMLGKPISDDVWREVVRVYHKAPISSEDIGLGVAVEIAQERTAQA